MTLPKGVDAGEVRDALKRILSTQPFVASARLAGFLQYVVEEELAGFGYRINERTIAVRALGRPSSFDPRRDASVRVVAGRVRRALESLDPGDVRIEIPVGTYVPRFTRPGPAPQDVAGEGRADHLREHPSASPRADSVIAVTPFRVSEPAHAGTAAALGDAVRAALEGFPGYRVRVEEPPAGEPDEYGCAIALGRTTGADTVLFGHLVTLRSAEWKASVRVVDGRTGELLWSRCFTAPHDTTPAATFVDDSARRLAAALADLDGVLSRHAHRWHPPRSTVHGAMRAFYGFVDTADPHRLPATLALLRALHAERPDDPLVTSMVAGLVAGDALVGAGLGAGGLPRARELAAQALVTGPDDPYVAVNVALVEHAADRLHVSATEAERAAHLAPGHPTVLRVAGVVLASIGRWEDGLELIEASRRLAEHDVSGVHQLILALGRHRAGDDTALAGMPESEPPGTPRTAVVRAVLLARQGRVSDARDALAAAGLSPGLAPQVRAVLVRDLWLRGEAVDELVDVLAPLSNHPGRRPAVPTGGPVRP